MAELPARAADAEGARMQTLRSYGIVDTEPEPEFDELVAEAARACAAPAAFLSLLETDRCWFKASWAPSLAPCPKELERRETFCGVALASSGPFVVPDALADPRFADLPLVRGPAAIRFYAGVPLVAPDGRAIGTICVLDRQPRRLSEQELSTLNRLAGLAMDRLEARRRRRHDEPPAATGKGPTVLIVDDEPQVRQFAAEVARTVGLAVLEARDGREALDLLARQSVAVVLTDMRMPGITGLQLVRAVRARPQPPQVVVMSGNFNDEDRRELRAASVSCLLSKPFTVEELQFILAQVRS